MTRSPAIDTGMLFLRILSPFYFVVSLKLVTDGILRGCGMMVRFMIATFSDLILRVGIAIVLSSTALGSTGIWMAWPVGWCIGTGLSLVFYFTAIRKILAESPAKAEAEGKAARHVQRPSSPQMPKWRPCNPFATCELCSPDTQTK